MFVYQWISLFQMPGSGLNHACHLFLFKQNSGLIFEKKSRFSDDYTAKNVPTQFNN